jgi:hypothetical protein
MKTALTFTALLFAVSLNAQVFVSGNVNDSLRRPIPFAVVYISNSTIGTSADSTGKYVLKVPQAGSYELIATCIGYQAFIKKIYLEGEDVVEEIVLKTKPQELNEVVVTAKDKIRKRNYARFCKIFLGETLEASSCKILNPEDLRLTMDEDTKILSGTSVKPLLIENKALGYRISYQLNDFKLYVNKGLFKYSGNPFFQVLEGTSKEMEQWRLNRVNNYYGSQMHFFRAFYQNRLEWESFRIYTDPAEGSYSGELELRRKDLCLAENTNNLEIYYPKPVRISFEKGKNSSSNATFSNVIRIYPNGFFEDGYSIIWQGEMGSFRMANMLPYDYKPGD